MTTNATRVQGYEWIIAGFLGAVGAVGVWLFAPQGREVESVWEFITKLAVFLCLILAISLFPNQRRSQYWLLYVAFVGFAGFIYPRISYFYYFDTARAEADSFYTHLYLLGYPGVVLTVTAAYRLGGGRAGHCLKIAGTGILIIFSGFLDVMWWLVNPVDLPTEIDAPHIMVFTGRPVTFDEAVLFAVAHIPLIVVLNLLPLDRWLQSWFPTADAEATTATTPGDGHRGTDLRPAVVGADAGPEDATGGS